MLCGMKTLALSAMGLIWFAAVAFVAWLYPKKRGKNSRA